MFIKNKDEHLPQVNNVRHLIKIEEEKSVSYKLLYLLS